MRLTPDHLDMTTAALRAVLPLEHPADAILRHFFVIALSSVQMIALSLRE